MRYSAPLAIAATALAAGLTIVAVRVLGPGAEAHPVTLVAAEHFGWIGYLTLSILLLAVGLRLLAVLPAAEWGTRVIAVTKVADATRDAWLVAHHPGIQLASIDSAIPSLLAIAAAAGVALLVVWDTPKPKPDFVPEIAA